MAFHKTREEYEWKQWTDGLKVRRPVTVQGVSKRLRIQICVDIWQDWLP